MKRDEKVCKGKGKRKREVKRKGGVQRRLSVVSVA